jgi:hypothetical protein
MVMFHPEIPYSVAERRGAVQQGILDRATQGRSSLTDIDWIQLDAQILDALAPVSPTT